MLIEGSNVKIAVLIPCYNVEKHIAAVINGIPQIVETIIAVNDASTDKTATILASLQEEDKRLSVISHKANKGVGGAMKSAFSKALETECNCFIKMDGDGQMDSHFISHLLRPIQQRKAHFTKGNRFTNIKNIKNMPFLRRIGNLGMSFLIKAASGYWNIFDPTNGYFCIHRNALQELQIEGLANDYFFESSLLIELSYTQAKIKDISMPAIYNDEISNLSIRKVLFSFPPRLLKALIKRIKYNYFLYDFNIGSIYLLTGIPLFLFGIIFGAVNWIDYANKNIPAPVGTIMVATLPIVLGFQLLLSAIQYDISRNSNNNA